MSELSDLHRAILDEAATLPIYATMSMEECLGDTAGTMDKMQEAAYERNKDKMVLDFVIEACQDNAATEDSELFRDFEHLSTVETPGMVNPLGLFFSIFHAVKD